MTAPASVGEGRGSNPLLPSLPDRSTANSLVWPGSSCFVLGEKALQSLGRSRGSEKSKNTASKPHCPFSVTGGRKTIEKYGGMEKTLIMKITAIDSKEKILAERKEIINP